MEIFPEKEKESDEKYLLIPQGKNILKIDYNQIIYMEKERNKVRVICEKSEYAYYTTIQKLKQHISHGIFHQCHQSIIVHKDKIKSMRENHLLLTNECIIPVSRKYKKSIKKLLLNTIEEAKLKSI
ncbi:MAG: LytR/AlgR family response regulator transcription factor [Eubacteriaceae bacterium]